MGWELARARMPLGLGLACSLAREVGCVSVLTEFDIFSIAECSRVSCAAAMADAAAPSPWRASLQASGLTEALAKRVADVCHRSDFRSFLQRQGLRPTWTYMPSSC